MFIACGIAWAVAAHARCYTAISKRSSSGFARCMRVSFSLSAAQMARTKLGSYTSARSAYGDLIKMMTALRSREAIARSS